MFKDRVKTIKSRLVQSSSKTASDTSTRAAVPEIHHPQEGQDYTRGPSLDVRRSRTVSHSVSIGSSSRVRSPPPPRPSRPDSLSLAAINPPPSPTIHTRLVRSPPHSPRLAPVQTPTRLSFLGLDRDHNHSHPQHFPEPQPSASDSAWFVPVPVLDKRVYRFEYQFGGTIGEGGFGKVMLALNIESRRQYAIKVISIKRLRSRRETASVANEIRALWRIKKSDSPFLARPADVQEWYWQYRGNVHLVMDYYRGGDLGRNIESFPELRHPGCFKIMVAEVVLALLSLHDMGIIHHDVKPANILIDKDGHCVLTDFGGSCFTSEDCQPMWQKDETPIFTLRYTAPEVLLNNHKGRRIGPAIDFWSLGMSLFELATGQDLIDEPDDDQCAHSIQHGLIDYDQLVLLTPYPGLRQFVSDLLVEDPNKRLGDHYVKSHSYLSSFSQRDFASINMKQRPPFGKGKQVSINPRNTSYDYIDRPGESLLDDANEDIVNRWLEEEGVGMPHHRDSDYHLRHKKNARVGLPYHAARRKEEQWDDDADSVGPYRI